MAGEVAVGVVEVFEQLLSLAADEVKGSTAIERTGASIAARFRYAEFP